jgi:predicted 3-demethylubiquinone-9 3-methyltransferase (glyoxalase superfamily)
MTTRANAATPDDQKNPRTSVRSITPCLTFEARAEDAVHYYVSVFENSRIVSMVHSNSDGPIPKGTMLHATFELNGREYTAFDGGPPFKFSQAFSLVATCDTQQELDEIWRKLSQGGQEGRCGWLTDQFGVSWQVIPAILGEMMSHPESGNAGKLMEALLQMGKLDIATLVQAYRS